jgi:hypothetical protein
MVLHSSNTQSNPIDNSGREDLKVPENVLREIKQFAKPIDLEKHLNSYPAMDSILLLRKLAEILIRYEQVTQEPEDSLKRDGTPAEDWGTACPPELAPENVWPKFIDSLKQRARALVIFRTTHSDTESTTTNKATGSRSVSWSKALLTEAEWIEVDYNSIVAQVNEGMLDRSNELRSKKMLLETADRLITQIDIERMKENW